MSVFKRYRRKGFSELRPYVPGEDLSGVSVQQDQTPRAGGMIARNPSDHSDQWYITPEYVAEHLELVESED